MAEYIDREKAYSILNSLYNDLDSLDISEPELWVDGFCECIGVCLDKVEDIPAADVAPVMHGSLKHTGTAWCQLWVCTNCNEVAYYPPHGNRKKRIIHPCGYKYCPNCGAKMDEEVNDT